MKHVVFIALGTNLGDRLANLEAALKAMAPSVNVLQRSPVYETPPWGFLEQPAFLNQVVEAETELSPQDLLFFLKQLETRMGRKKMIENGPRLIDLDILLYDDLILKTPDLTIPHPRMVGRGFVLVPLADLAPDLRHPVLGSTIAELAEQSDKTGIRPFSE